MTKKRIRSMPIYVWVRPDEMEVIQGRMAEAGISNMSAYVRKMALNGYVLHVDLSDIRELVSLQRRCANNLNQVAIQANTYGGIYPRGNCPASERLCGPLGAAVRSAQKTLRCDGALNVRGMALCRPPVFSTSGQSVPKWGKPKASLLSHFYGVIMVL